MSNTYHKQLPSGFLDVFQVATLPSTHQGVFVEFGGKAIRATTEQGFLNFGPYRENYPQQPLQAVFSILVDNNTADNLALLVLDVYDHHSGRVLESRRIKRKDFPRANDFCIFTLDFTPPSPHASMEFRIFYLGNSYVRADKIAVVDPAHITIRNVSQLSQLEGTPEPAPSQPSQPVVTPEPTPSQPSQPVVTPEPAPSQPSQPVVTPEPARPPQQAPGVNINPWQVATFGRATGTISAYQITDHKIDSRKSEFLFRGFLTVDAYGSTQGCDDVLFPYIEWKDQFGHARIWVAYFSPYSQGFIGVMIRESLDPNSKFILLEGHRVLYRSTYAGSIAEKILTEPHFPQELRMDRHGHHENQSFELYIVKKNNQEISESIPLNLADHLYVGPAIGTFQGNFEMCTKYKDKAGTYTPENSQC